MLAVQWRASITDSNRFRDIQHIHQKELEEEEHVHMHMRMHMHMRVRRHLTCAYVYSHTNTCTDAYAHTYPYTMRHWMDMCIPLTSVALSLFRKSERATEVRAGSLLSAEEHEPHGSLI